MPKQSLENFHILRVCRDNLDARNSSDDAALSSVLTLATGSANAQLLRTEEWQGRSYEVVPVVAIVEGVLQGANASGPEFAAASEFGKFPKAWDGRPVVMNHPQLNGVFVSAAIPEVLADFGMGVLFNTRLEGKKLKTEAWLDTEKIEAAGGEALETLERIRNGEMVEVSVGAWLDLRKEQGVYGGKPYIGAWQNVAPDHLAFLSEGTQGACSIKDGCGVPRLFSVNHAAIGKQASCCESCTEGKECTVSKRKTEDPANNARDKDTGDKDAKSKSGEKLQQLSRTNQFHRMLVHELGESLVNEEGESLVVNAVPSDMDVNDLKIIVFQGLREVLNLPSYDLDMVALTSNQVVYHIWGKAGLFARDITVDEQGNIEFSADETAVNLLTRIVPRQTTEPNVNNVQENDMPNAPGGGDPNPQEQEAGSTPAENSTSEPNANKSEEPSEETPAVQEAPTFEKLLAAASPETRQAIEQGTAVYKAQRAALVAQLVACEHVDFTEDELKDYDLNMLQKLSKTANLPSYAGVAIPEGDAGTISTNSSEGPKVAEADINYLAASAGN